MRNDCKSVFIILVFLLLTFSLPGQAENLFDDLQSWSEGASTAESSTSARFKIGITADDGKTFPTAFDASDSINIFADIQVASEHLGKTGWFYAVVRYNGQWYVKNAEGVWQLWNYQVANLVSVAEPHALQNLEHISIAAPFPGKTGAFEVFIGYRVDQAIYYNAQSANFVVIPSGSPLEKLKPWVNAISTPAAASAAHFKIGITADNRKTFGSRFNSTDNLNVLVDMSVAPEHIGKQGWFYTMVRYNDRWYMKNAQGQWQPGDYQLASLVSFSGPSTLKELESLTIAEQLTGLTGTFDVYVGYRATSTDSALHYNARKVSFIVSRNIMPSVNVNAYPIAYAGVNQYVDELSPVTLDAGQSTDIDGQIVSYQWQQILGPSVTLTNPNSVRTGFKAPEVSQATELRFRLTITDNLNAVASADVTVMVRDITIVDQWVTPPVCGLHQILQGGDCVTPPTTPTCVAPTVLVNGFCVTPVFNCAGPTFDQSCAITNYAPIANAGVAQTIAARTEVALDGSKSLDSDGSIASVLWEQIEGPTVILSNAEATNPTFTAPDVPQNSSLLFKLTVTDNQGAKATATVVVNVLYVPPVNQAPTAYPDHVTIEKDKVKVFTLVGTDPDADVLKYIVDLYPTNGTVSLRGNTLTYRPDADFNGSDSFTFIVNDGKVDSLSATVTLSVMQINDLPIATNVNVTTNEDSNKSISLSAVDVDNDPLTYHLVTGPTHGTVTLVDNVATYTPNLNYNGLDSFTFKVNDGKGDSLPATVAIAITPINDMPVATSASITMNEDAIQAISLSAFDVDNDSLTYHLVTGPVFGTVNISGNAATYLPRANYHGSDSFTFKVNDGLLDSASATITITVNPVNDLPVATNLTVQVDENSSKAIILLGTDADNDPLVYSKVSDPIHGTISISGNIATYTPTGGFRGSDSFTYKVNDGLVDSVLATVTISVTAVNHAPVAISASGVGNEDQNQVFVLSGTDSDNDPLSYSIVAYPGNGSVSLNGNSATYTPKADYNGPDSFTFKVNDGKADSEPATITITISAVNDIPLANSVNVTMDEDALNHVITLSGSDVDNDPLTYSLVTGVSHGIASLNGNTVTYTPSADYNGQDSFTFKVNDGTTDSQPATVKITVNPVNDKPIATNGTAIVNQYFAKDITLSGSDIETAPANLTYAITAQPSHGGQVTVSGNIATYTPESPYAYTGPDSFDFTVTDGDGLTSTIAHITLEVTKLSLLNDTGITLWADGVNVGLSFVQINFPGQDADSGRDVDNNDPNDGQAGFSFTKICVNGKRAGQLGCPADPQRGSNPDNWGCTQDNVTGLIWEIKTDDAGLHDKDWLYSWYEPDPIIPNPVINGGGPGTLDPGLLVICHSSTLCNSHAYLTAVNSGSGWCGYKDWRMPTMEELGGIVNYGREKPSIDIAYFPETDYSIPYWSSSTFADSNSPDYARYVHFYYGFDDYATKDNSFNVRLVRKN